MTVMFITSGVTFTAPGDWPGTADTVEVIGGGGGGAGNANESNVSPGGGGGAYSLKNTVTAANGATIQVGAGHGAG